MSSIAVGAGPTLRERLMCLNADTGKVVWEYANNVLPQRRSSSPCRVVCRLRATPRPAMCTRSESAAFSTPIDKNGKVLWTPFPCRRSRTGDHPRRTHRIAGRRRRSRYREWHHDRLGRTGPRRDIASWHSTSEPANPCGSALPVGVRSTRLIHRRSSRMSTARGC